MVPLRPRPALAALLLAVLGRGAPAADAPVLDLSRAAPESVGMSAQRLAEMDALARSGELKKITSLLVARHGKLVHETYLEGSADTLRDTRSATKTITGMLAGIAVDAGLLPGVGARVVPYFPELRRLKNPDRPQGRDHGRGPPHDELDPRVQRLERVLPRQRGAHVPDRGLGPVRARPARARVHARRRAREAALRPRLQLLHRRRRDARRRRPEGGEEAARRVRRRAAVPSARHRAREMGLFAARAPDGRRRAPPDEPGSPEARAAST